jgi:hypothetical protein
VSRDSGWSSYIEWPSVGAADFVCRGLYFYRLKYCIYSVYYGVIKVSSDTRIAKGSYSYMCAKYHVLKNQSLLNLQYYTLWQACSEPHELHNTVYS